MINKDIRTLSPKMKYPRPHNRIREFCGLRVLGDLVGVGEEELEGALVVLQEGGHTGVPPGEFPAQRERLEIEGGRLKGGGDWVLGLCLRMGVERGGYPSKLD